MPKKVGKDYQQEMQQKDLQQRPPIQHYPGFIPTFGQGQFTPTPNMPPNTIPNFGQLPNITHNPQLMQTLLQIQNQMKGRAPNLVNPFIHNGMMQQNFPALQQQFLNSRINPPLLNIPPAVRPTTPTTPGRIPTPNIAPASNIAPQFAQRFQPATPPRKKPTPRKPTVTRAPTIPPPPQPITPPPPLIPPKDDTATRALYAEANDKQQAMFPDYKTPFQSKEDMYKRLLVYHVFNGETYLDNNWDKKVEIVAKKFIEIQGQINDKLAEYTEKETNKQLSTEEILFLDTLLFKEEERQWLQEKALLERSRAQQNVKEEPKNQPMIINLTNNVTPTTTPAFQQPVQFTIKEVNQQPLNQPVNQPIQFSIKEVNQPIQFSIKDVNQSLNATTQHVSPFTQTDWKSPFDLNGDSEMDETMDDESDNIFANITDYRSGK
jgi:hypothetical protein